MNAYIFALCWTLPMLGLAVLNVYGLVSDDMMKTMLAITPALAVISIDRNRRCLKARTSI